MKGPFGYCIHGFHEAIQLNSDDASSLNRIVGEVLYVNNVKTSEVDELKCAMDRFFSIEGLGIQCFPQCGGCKCGKCAIGSSNYAIQDEKELKMIEDGLVCDEKSCAWTVTYPVKKDYGNLPNNLPSAIQRLKHLEKRLLSMGN